MAIEVKTDMTGSVWKVLVQVGDVIAPDQDVVILESMKMEIPVIASEGGRVREILVKEADVVQEGDTIIILDPA